MEVLKTNNLIPIKDVCEAIDSFFKSKRAFYMLKDNRLIKEEVLGEIFEHVYTRFPHNISNIRAWVSKTSKNKLMDIVKRERKFQLYQKDDIQ